MSTKLLLARMGMSPLVLEVVSRKEGLTWMDRFQLESVYAHMSQRHLLPARPRMSSSIDGHRREL